MPIVNTNANAADAPARATVSFARESGGFPGTFVDVTMSEAFIGVQYTCFG